MKPKDEEVFDSNSQIASRLTQTIDVSHQIFTDLEQDSKMCPCV